MDGGFHGTCHLEVDVGLLPWPGKPPYMGKNRWWKKPMGKKNNPRINNHHISMIYFNDHLHNHVISDISGHIETGSEGRDPPFGITKFSGLPFDIYTLSVPASLRSLWRSTTWRLTSLAAFGHFCVWSCWEDPQTEPFASKQDLTTWTKNKSWS